MFINSSEISTALAFNDSEWLPVNSIFTSLSNSDSEPSISQNPYSCLSLIIAEPLQGQAVDTSLISCKGNFDALFIVYFPPNHFTYFFGSAAIQTINSITIQKSDLPGLNPLVNNTAESLFVGLLGIALSGKNIVEFPSITLKYWGYGSTEGKRIDTVLVDIRKKIIFTNEYEIPVDSSVIDPDNY